MKIDGFSSATDMLSALRAGRISSTELLELHIERIERYNPSLNAIIVLDLDRARDVASEADEQRRQGRERPLLGLPLTIKEAIDVEGLPTTCGSRRRQDVVARSDAVAVARLRDAGAVIVGKTNVPPYTGDWQTDNAIYGRTNNPWDLTRTPGGSTGGGAAAVAAGLSPIELGSDIGGSIRLPASFCGIYGHRPSDTLISATGHFPGHDLLNVAAVLNVVGPLTRFASDLEVALDVTAGPEPGEDVAWQIALPAPRAEALRDLRIAVLPETPWLPLDADVSAAVERVGLAAERAGARVETTQPVELGDLRGHHLEYEAMLSAIFNFNAGTDEERLKSEAAELRQSSDELEAARLRGLTATAGEFLRLHHTRAEYRAAYRRFFKDWDILLAPITMIPAFPHDDAPQDQRVIEVNGQPVPYSRQMVYPGLASFSGQPATAFPAGSTGAGLPIGLQAIGPYLEDLTPIRFAELIAEEIGGFSPPPGYEQD